MNSKEYSTAILPIIIKSIEIDQKNKLTNVEKHLQYLCTQALYGYEEFGKRFISKMANEKYLECTHNVELKNIMSREQNTFDPSGKKKGGIFHLEHVFTHKMFRNMLIEKYIGNKILSVEDLEEVMNKNYATAWILSSENTTLNENHFRSNRGKTLEDALECYHKTGIELMGPFKIQVNL